MGRSLNFIKMKKIFLFAFLLYSTCILADGEWTGTFHPGNKRGLPDRYSYVYADSAFTIMFRTDIKPITIVLANQNLITDMSELHITVYDSDMNIISEFKTDYVIDKNTIVINDWKIRDAFLKGNFVKVLITFEQGETILKIDRLDINKKTKYSVD